MSNQLYLELNRRPDLTRLRVPFTLSVCALAITWTLLANVERASRYPQPVLDALGFVLAALVFALGFAQQALKRALDDALAEARRRDEAVIQAATRDSPMITLEVYEQAQLQVSDLDEAGRQLRTFGPKLARLARRFGRWREVDDERVRLAMAKAFRDRYERAGAAEQRDGRFDRSDEEWRRITQLSGIRGHMAVAGIATEGAGEAFEALSVGRVFLVSMWGLAITGVLYSSAAQLFTPSIDLWIVVTLLGLAHAYQRLIRWDMTMSLSRFEARLRALPLTELWRAETCLAGAGDQTPVDPASQECAAPRISRQRGQPK